MNKLQMKEGNGRIVLWHLLINTKKRGCWGQMHVLSFKKMNTLKVPCSLWEISSFWQIRSTCVWMSTINSRASHIHNLLLWEMSKRFSWSFNLNTAQTQQLPERMIYYFAIMCISKAKAFVNILDQRGDIWQLHEKHKVRLWRKIKSRYKHVLFGDNLQHKTVSLWGDALACKLYSEWNLTSERPPNGNKCDKEI